MVFTALIYSSILSNFFVVEQIPELLAGLSETALQTVRRRTCQRHVQGFRTIAGENAASQISVDIQPAIQVYGYLTGNVHHPYLFSLGIAICVD